MEIDKTNWTDEQILQALQQGGRRLNEAFNQIYGRQGKAVLAWLSKNVSAEEAKDILSDSMIAFYRSASRQGFTFTKSLESYLFTIARNQLFAVLEKNRTKIRVAFPDHISADEPSPLRILLGKEELDARLSKIGERCKKILLMSGQGYSMQELADEMGWASERVARHEKYECMAKLRKAEAASSTPLHVKSEK